MTRTRIVLGLCFAILGLGIAPAHADEETLVTSIPGVRQEAGQMPSRAVLAFSMALDPDGKATEMKVLDSSGKIVSGSDFVVEQNNASVDLAYPLPRGTYTVHYRVVSADTGKTYGGSYQFAYGPGSFTKLANDAFGGAGNVPAEVAPEEPEPEPTESASPSPTPTPSATASAGPSTDEATDAGTEGVRWWLPTGLGALLLFALAIVVARLRKRSG